MVFVASARGVREVESIQRAGRILPIYVVPVGCQQAAVGSGLRIVGRGEVDGQFCVLWCYPGLGYLVVRNLFGVRDAARRAWWAARDESIGCVRALHAWWREQLGYRDD
jgi:hypothetical protein